MVKWSIISSCDWPVLARDMRRYFSLVGVPSLAPAVAMANAEAAESALRLLSSSRQDDTTMPLLKENRENSTWRKTSRCKVKALIWETLITFENFFLWTVHVRAFGTMKVIGFSLFRSCGYEENPTRRGQQRAKTTPAQCVLQLVAVTVYTPLCLPHCLIASPPPFLPAFLRSAGGGIEEHAHRC